MAKESRYKTWREEQRAGVWSKELDEWRVKASTYYYRDRKLKSEGFLPFEREEFCMGRIGTLGMQMMRGHRRKWFNQALWDAEAKGISEIEFRTEVWPRRVRSFYRRKYRESETGAVAHAPPFSVGERWRYGDGSANPWAYLDAVRLRYRVRATPDRRAKVFKGRDELTPYMKKSRKQVRFWGR